MKRCMLCVFVALVFFSGCSAEQPESYQSRLLSTHELVPLDTLTFHSSDSIFVTRVGQISSWHEYIFISDFYRATVMVFDTMFHYKRTLGRKGRGPGEFQYFPTLVTAYDTLYLFDDGLLRVTKYDRRLSFISTSTLPNGFFFRHQAVVLKDKFVVAMNPARTITKAKDLVGEEPLMVLDMSFEVVTRFWKWSNTYFANDLATATYSIQNADVLLTTGWDAGVFAMQKASYAITRFTKDLKIQKTFGRQPQYRKDPPPISYEQSAYSPEMISNYAGSTNRFLLLACDTLKRFVLANYVNLDSTVFFRRTMLAGHHFLPVYDEKYGCVFDGSIPGLLAFVRAGKIYILTHEQPEFMRLVVFSLEAKRHARA